MHNGEKGDDSYIENNDVVKASAPPAYEDSDYGDNVYYTKPAFEDGEYSRMAHLRKITPGAPSVSMPHLGYIIPPEQRTLSAALALFFGVGVWGLILYGSYYVAEFNNNPSAYSVTDADDLLKTLAWGIAVGVVLGSFFTNLARQKELSREAHKFAEANTESKDVSARGALSDKTLEKYSQETRNREYVGHFIGILFLGLMFSSEETRVYAAVAGVLTAFAYKLAIDKAEEKNLYIKYGKTFETKTQAQLDQEFRENLIGGTIALGLSALMGYVGYMRSDVSANDTATESAKFEELLNCGENTVLAASIMILVGGFLLAWQISSKAENEYNARAEALQGKKVTLSTENTPRHYEDHVKWGRRLTVASLLGCVAVNLLQGETSSEVYAIGQGLFAITAILAVVTAKMIEKERGSKLQFLRDSSASSKVIDGGKRLQV